MFNGKIHYEYGYVKLPEGILVGEMMLVYPWPGHCFKVRCRLHAWLQLAGVGEPWGPFS